jgi:uncharacterized protein YlxP (DUF503 family)
MHTGILTLHIRLPGCDSLKAKRGRIKPLLARLHKEFNISAAEVDQLDSWQEAVIACALVGNDGGHIDRHLRKLVGWLERHWPDIMLISEQIEIIQ